jgi:hypothetical protein
LPVSGTMTTGKVPPPVDPCLSTPRFNPDLILAHFGQAYYSTEDPRLRNKSVKMTKFCLAQSGRALKGKNIRPWFEQHRSLLAVSRSPPLPVPAEQVCTPPTFPTPDDLVTRLRRLDKLPLTALPGDFNECVHATARKHYCPYSYTYSSSTTGQSVFHSRQKWSCDGGPWKPCSSRLEFRIRDGIIHSIPSVANLCHEHPTTEEYFRLISRLLTSDELHFIQVSIPYGASPGTIRSKLGTVIPP